MARALSRTVKLDLPAVAQSAAADDGASSPQLLQKLQETFGCKRRAAQDAPTILVRGGWLERRDDKHDARRKRYFVTETARHDLQTTTGHAAMRYARRRYSTTSSTRRRRAAEPDRVTAAFLDSIESGKEPWPGLMPRRRRRQIFEVS